MAFKLERGANGQKAATISTVLYVTLCIAAIAYFAAIIAAFVGLIPLGYWHDEFATFAFLRSGGIHYCFLLMLHWIPRPLSDLFVFLYGWSCIVMGREMITSALAPVWFLLFACTVLAPFAFFRHANGMAKFAVAVLAMALMSSFLLGHPIAEAFYWPMAAFAYLPTLAGASLLLWSLCAGDAESLGVNLIRGGALLAAAFSSEIGAIFAFAFASMGLALPATFSVLRKKRLSIRPIKWWLAVPLAGAMWVLYKVATGRAEDLHEGTGFGDYAVRHHAINSLMAAGPAFTHEIFSLDSDTGAGLLTKAVFIIGAYLTLSMLPRKSGHRVASYHLINLVIAAVATSFITIAAGFYQYGMNCCQHHATTRQDLIFIALVAAAGVPVLFGHGVSRQNWRRGVAAVMCLALAVTIPMFTAVPQLASDYMYYDAIRVTKTQNWAAGMSPAASMTFVVPAQGEVVGGLEGVNGVDNAVDSPAIQRGVVQFFNKQEITFIPAHERVSLADVTPLVRRIEVAAFVPHAASNAAQPVISESCALDPIDSQAVSSTLTVSPKDVIPISGWALMNKPARLPSSVSLMLQSSHGDFLVRAIPGDLRADVATYFGLPPSMSNSGFHVNADLSGVPDGQYTLSVHTAIRHRNETCGAFIINVER